LEEFLAKVIDTGVPAEGEVWDHAGHWFALRARPFVTSANQIDGAVLMLVDIDALKQTERRIQEARDFGQAVIESVPPLLILNQDLRVQTANGSFYRTFQVTPAQTEDLPVFELGNGQWNIPALRALLEDILPGHTTVENYEVTHEFEHLGRRTMLVNARQVGSLQTILLSIEDITERRRKEEQLRLHLAVLQSTANAIVFTGRDGLIQWVNPALTTLTGYSAAEAIGRNPRLFSSGKQDRAFYRQMWETISAGRPWHGELTNKRKDGSFYPEELTITPVTNADGRISHFIAIKQDVTERKAAEQALRDLADQRRLALESGNVGTWDYQPATGEVLWDERSYAIFGIAGGRMDYEKFLAVLHPKDQERVDRAVKQATSPDSSGDYDIEYRVVWPDGSIHWVLAKGQAYFEGAGPERRTARFIGTNMDISERKQLEEVLAGRRAELESLVADRTAKLNETIGELEHFSHAIIHDMRAPLRAVQGFATMLSEEFGDRLPPLGQDYYLRIQGAMHRMDRLITDSLQYGKAVREELTLTPVDVPRLLRGIIESYPNLQPPGAEINVELDELRVEGNEAALAQCFSNLLGNAVQFATPGIKPKIRVWAEFRNQDPGTGTRRQQEPPAQGAPQTTSDLSMVRIWVEDNGIGIAKAAQARIFDMFQRGTNQQEGTGIGLAIVRKLAQRMGGAVGVESEEAKGCRFWLDLVKTP
jgi:PAS domain S-box-containing protein